MARFRRNSIRPVHRIKHVIDNQGGGILNVQTGATVINTVDAPVLANTNEVETGATVNGIYLHVEANFVSGAGLPNLYLSVFKNPGGNITAPDGNAVGSSDNKKYVIHQQMIMLNADVGGNPRVVFDGVIVIPKGYRRFGINDILKVLLFSPALSYNFCIQTIYKEFR